MAAKVHDTNIDGIPGDLIKAELLKIVKNQLRSENCELFIEPGSKEGKHNLNIQFQFWF